jgi:nucleoside-diphosphate-sugar epimerase
MNRVLITGGNGFLGSNLTRFFLKKKYKVMVISRNSINLTDILDSIEFVKHLNPGYIQFEDQIKTFLPTVVIHCAWDGSNAYKDLNNLTQINNITQSTELLQLLITLSVKPIFVGVGTFSEYGIINSLVNETIPDSPINLYGLTKSCFKNISNMICEQNNIKWIWVRPCLIYGKYDVSTRLIPTLIRKLRAGENVILDSCNTIVDYLHV